MEKYALLLGGAMFFAEGIAKFIGVTFRGMNMPCDGSLGIVGLGALTYRLMQAGINPILRINSLIPACSSGNSHGG